MHTQTHTHTTTHSCYTYTHARRLLLASPWRRVGEKHLGYLHFYPMTTVWASDYHNTLMPRCSSANKELHAHWHHPSNYVNKMFYTDTIVYRPCIFPSSSPPTSLLSPFLSNKILKKATETSHKNFSEWKHFVTCTLLPIYCSYENVTRLCCHYKQPNYTHHVYWKYTKKTLDLL